MDTFRIGELAKQAGVHVETLRYYERRGLIPKAHRTVSNYRVYSSENLRRVVFIKQAQGLGFSLLEIKKLLELRAAPRARCADVRRHATVKIQDIDEKMRSLALLRKNLERLLKQCDGDVPATQCPILESLGSDHSSTPQKVAPNRKESDHERKAKTRNL